MRVKGYERGNMHDHDNKRGNMQGKRGTMQDKRGNMRDKRENMRDKRENMRGHGLNHDRNALFFLQNIARLG